MVSNISYTKRKIAALLLAGLVSGLLSYICFQYIDIGGVGMFIAPGLIFGIIIALAHGTLFESKKTLGFLFLSIAGYFIAFNIYWILNLSANGGGIGLGVVGILFISSFVGSFLFLLGYNFISSLSFNPFIMLLIWGVILSLAFFKAASSDPYLADNSFDHQLAIGFIIWQGGMALGLGFVTIKKLQNAFMAGLIILVLGLIGIVSLKSDTTGNAHNQIKNGYQAEIDRLILPNFTLVSSNMDPGGIDAPATLTDDYTAHLPPSQAISLIDSNIRKNGFTPSGLYEMRGSCQGGPLTYTSNTGSYLGFCLKKISTGEITIEIELNGFSETPVKSQSPGTCVGDCKNQ